MLNCALFSPHFPYDYTILYTKNPDSTQLTTPTLSGIKHMYSKYGQIYKELGELYDTGPLNGSKPVNVAIIGTGRCYQEISEVYENQVS